MFNVGVDRSVGYAPWALDDIVDILVSEGMISKESLTTNEET